MDIKLKKPKLFLTKDEKEQQKTLELEKDSEFGHPDQELGKMYNVTKWGIRPFQAITFLSTAMFIFLVAYEHTAEIIGKFLAYIICGVVSVVAAIAIERMLEGNWDPFFKKAFILKKADVVLGGLGLLFSGIVLAGAFAGMDVLADSAGGEQKVESVAGIAQTNTDAIAANNAKIAEIQAGKVKGMNVKGKEPNWKGNNEIAALRKANQDLATTTTAIAGSTNHTNDLNKEIKETKVQKARKYLGKLAAGSELIKFIIFVFWGYRSLQLKKFKEGKYYEDEEEESEYIAPKTKITPVTKTEQKTIDRPSPTPGMGNGQAMTDTDWLNEYYLGRNQRKTLTTRFKDHFIDGKFKYDDLEEQWLANEKRMDKACKAINAQYEYNRIPAKDDFLERVS